MRRLLGFSLLTTSVLAIHAAPTSAQAAAAPDSVHFYGLTERSMLAAGVVIPANRAVVWTSGTVPPLLNDRAEAGTPERYGDTRIQAVGILGRIADQLDQLGLSLQDIVYLRAYLVPDPTTGQIDTRGWNEAYAEFFGTPENPTRPARSTVGVAALVDPGWLIEIEAFAVYGE